MATKYIVNNVSGQTINGDITINGNLSVTGVTTGSLSTYKALLTQLGSQTGTTLGGFGGFNDGLIIGETYTVNLYESGDDFSNIADLESGGVLGISYSGVSPSDGSFSGLTGTTDGFGTGATFDVSITSGVTSTTRTLPGQGYQEGNTITILGTDIGGTSPTNDLTITVTGLTPNSTGSVFVATGEIPTNWSNGSTLVSSGNLAVTVLENNLGYDIEWANDDEFQPGFYLGFNSTTGPLYNTFNRNTTFVQGGESAIPFFGPFISETFALPISFNEKDDSVVVAIFDLSEGPTPVSDNLYYFPIEIQIKQDLDTTPIVISGTVETSFPITFTSIDLRCNGNYIQTLYGNGTVNDMSELITYLNSETNTSYLGTYSDAGDGGVLLEMSTNLVNQFCSSGTLTFEVFND
jgi:hypothetical protein